METEHLSGYQSRDWDVVDYQYYQQEESSLYFRGPEAPVEKGEYFTCIGAAQTLGCFCEKPYPAILEESLGHRVLNLGYGGAGPAFFVKHPALIDVINRGRFVVLQVMSGRSESNELFDSGGLEFLRRKSDGSKVAAQQAYRELVAEHMGLAGFPPPIRKAIRMVSGKPALKRILSQTRANWVQSNKALIEAIEVPVILFWYSRRAPGWNRTKRLMWNWQRYDDVNAMFGDYPQLVNARMMNEIKPHADAYVECVTSRGSPQPLINRFTGKPALIDRKNDRPDLHGQFSENAYYPSPQMHEDAAESLKRICETFWNA